MDQRQKTSTPAKLAKLTMLNLPNLDQSSENLLNTSNVSDSAFLSQANLNIQKIQTHFEDQDIEIEVEHENETSNDKNLHASCNFENLPDTESSVHDSTPEKVRNLSQPLTIEIPDSGQKSHNLPTPRLSVAEVEPNLTGPRISNFNTRKVDKLPQIFQNLENLQHNLFQNYINLCSTFNRQILDIKQELLQVNVDTSIPLPINESNAHVLKMLDDADLKELIAEKVSRNLTPFYKKMMLDQLAGPASSPANFCAKCNGKISNDRTGTAKTSRKNKPSSKKAAKPTCPPVQIESTLIPTERPVKISTSHLVTSQPDTLTFQESEKLNQKFKTQIKHVIQNNLTSNREQANIFTEQVKRKISVKRRASSGNMSKTELSLPKI